MREAIDKQVSESALLSSVNQAITSLLVAEGKRAPLVFFSYSHLDREIVTLFASGLHDEGLDVWFDQDAINMGQSIPAEISSGLDSTDILVFFISKNSINSRWAQLELNAIILRRLSGEPRPLVLPILLDDADIPPLLRDRRYLDLRDGDVDRGIQELSKSIQWYLKRKQRNWH